MISLYISGRSWAHRLPAGLKLAVLLAVSFAVLILDNWRGLLLLMVGLAIAYGSLGRPGLLRLWGLRFLLPLILGLGAFQAVVMGGELAANTVTRVFCMVMLADLVTATTPMQQMLLTMGPIFVPLRYLGINDKSLGLAVALMVRFIPVLIAQWRAHREAWLARTGRKPGLRLLVPFMGQTLARSDRVAEALFARSPRR